MWSSSVCFLCVKTFNKENIENCLNNNRSKLKVENYSTRFAIFCERFLKLPQESSLISILRSNKQQKQSSSGTSSFLDQFCSECLEILDVTFQLYNELTEIQLKMAWRLGQWEALLNPKISKPSSKLSSILQHKLSKQLELNFGIGGTEEVRKMRSLLLSHCTKALNEILDHRKLEVTLDRCSVPFPVASNDHGTKITSFIVLDSNPPLSKDVHEDDVVVKRELDDQEFECADFEDSAIMDFEADDDFLNTNPKQLAPAPSSSAAVQETLAAASLRRSAKNNNFCYFPKKPYANKVKVEKDKVKKRRGKVSVEGDGFPCQLCGRTMATLEILRRHLYAHVNKRFGTGKRPSPTFQCRFCWKRFIFEQQRWIHEQMETHDKAMTSMKFTCFEESCNGKPPFSSFNDLEAHFESVHQTKNESVHKCSICQWPFTSNDLRQVHELNHRQYPKNGDRPRFKCPKCEGQTFCNFSSMKTHFISEHTNIEDVRIHKCHKCSNSYRKVISLEDHLKTHEMEEDLAKTEETVAGSSKYISCKECGKPFATSRILAEHKQQVHRKVQCTVCGKIIIRKLISRHMKQHSNTDTNEPEHPCPICHKMFLGKVKLKRHMKHVHPEGKESEGEVCHICSKKYQRKGLLHRHLRIAHQIEAEEMKRPAKYVCPHCGMGYHYECSLNNHIDSKHRRPEERKFHFPCALCSRTFWRKSVLTKHLEKTHGQAEATEPTLEKDHETN